MKQYALSLFLVLALSGGSASAVAQDSQWVRSYFDAKGGCGSINIITFESEVEAAGGRGALRNSRWPRTMFGRPVEEVSDQNIQEAVAYFMRCFREGTEHSLRDMAPSDPRRQEEREKSDTVWGDLLEPVRRDLMNVVEEVRQSSQQRRAQVKAQRKIVEEQAKREVESAERSRREMQEVQETTRRMETEAIERAQRDRIIAAELTRQVEVEERRLAEIKREADEARKVRETAQQRLVEIRSAITAEAQRKQREEQANVQPPPERQDPKPDAAPPNEPLKEITDRLSLPPELPPTVTCSDYKGNFSRLARELYSGFPEVVYVPSQITKKRQHITNLPFVKYAISCDEAGMFTSAGADTLDTDINTDTASLARWQIFVHCVVGSVNEKLTMADVAKLVYGLQDAAHTNARKNKDQSGRYFGSKEHPIGNYVVIYRVRPTYYDIQIWPRNDPSRSG